MTLIDQFRAQLESSDKIVFFGGAGVSTESGIPDFRSADGIFMQDTGMTFSSEQVISYSFFQQYPAEFFAFYFDKLIYPEAEPNISHQFMAQLEQEGKEVTVVTQNIDGLHQDAGSRNVYELHGTVRENYCLTCNQQYSLDEIERDEKGIPRCQKDQGIVRPNVVLYEEGLDQSILSAAISAIEEADMLIIAGTSLVVYPAAGLVNYFNGEHLVVINKTVLQTRQNALVFEDTLGNVFGQIIN